MADWSPLAKIVLNIGLFLSFFGLEVIGLGILAFTLWAARGKLGLLSGGIIGAGFMVLECFILKGTGLQAESADSKAEITLALYVTIGICLISLIVYTIIGLKIANAHKMKTGTR